MLCEDRSDTIKELTIHFAGTAVPRDDIQPSPRKGKGRAKKSPWIGMITAAQSALEVLEGGVVVGGNYRKDFGVEGSMRWTRTCNKQWNGETERFEPLVGGGSIVVSEDSTLIFMYVSSLDLRRVMLTVVHRTAIDVSQHLADGTLIKHLKSIRAGLAAGDTFFVMVHGLEALYTALKSVVSLSHAHEVRKVMGEDVGVFKEKRAGIGEGQPSRDEIELGLLRAEEAVKCLYICVEKEVEAVEWLVNLSMDVGAKPYQCVFSAQKYSNCVDSSLQTTEAFTSCNSGRSVVSKDADWKARRFKRHLYQNALIHSQHHASGRARYCGTVPDTVVTLRRLPQMCDGERPARARCWNRGSLSLAALMDGKLILRRAEAQQCEWNSIVEQTGSSDFDKIAQDHVSRRSRGLSWLISPCLVELSAMLGALDG